MLKKALLLLCSFLLFMVGLVDLASAASPVEISAKDSVRFDLTTHQFFAEGDVVIEFDDLTLYGDRLLWDSDKQILYLDGNVIMEQSEERFYGDSLVYNVETSQGTFEQVYSEFSGENINGLIFVFGDQMHIDGDDFHIVQGKVSTCDLSTPHYHLAIKSIQVYPGEKMIIRGVTYYEGKIPLFYWPYLAIPLDNRFDVDYFNLPEVGYSAKDGYYIKNRYNYFITQNANGTIFYDYYTKHGFGLGLNHNYGHRSLGKGNFAFYSIPATHRQYFSTQLNHEYEQDNLKLTTKNAYYQELVDDILEVKRKTQTSLYYRREGLTVTGSVNYEDEIGSSESRDMTLAGSWNQKITPNLDLNLRGSVTAKDDERVINQLAETAYRLNNHTFSLSFQQQYNPDILDPEATASWRSVNKLPEFTWRWQNPTFNGQRFPGRFELGVGRYLEYPSLVVSWRVAPKLELSSRTWRSDFGTTLTYSGGLAGYFYDYDLSQQVAHGRISLVQSLTPNLRFSSTYNRQVVFGETLFRFDQQNPRHTLTGQLSYTNRPFTASIRTGYNFELERFDSLVQQVSWNNYNAGLNLSATMYYNLNTKQFGNLVTMFNYRPHERFNIRLGSRYQLNNQRFERVDSQLSFDLTEKIAVKYDMIYDMIKQKFTRGELTVTIDLHCRELSLAYNQVREEFRVKYSLNAFPKLPLGFSSTDGISLFELTDLQELLGIDSDDDDEEDDDDYD